MPKNVCRSVLCRYCLLLAFLTALDAKASQIHIDHVFDLGMETTQAFLQDHSGLLWIGTLSGGLFTYDGYQRKSYGLGPNMLANGHVRTIIEDESNPDILWLITLGNGLTRLETSTETFTHYRAHSVPDNGLFSDSIADLAQDRADPDILWVIGSDGFLQKFNKTTGRFSPPYGPDHKALPEHTEFFNILADQRDPNIFWITGQGLIKFDKQEETFTPFQHDPHNSESLGFPSNFIGSIAQDADQPEILWLGYWDGAILDRFNTQTETFTHYKHTPDTPNSLRDGAIQMLYDDGEGTLWIGGWAESNGLTAFDKQTERFTSYTHSATNPSSLSTDAIVNVSKDASGILWIIHSTGKVDKYDPHNQNFTLYQHNAQSPNSLINNAVYSFYEDRDGLLWFGTIKGLSALDRKTNTFRNYLHEPDNPDSLDNDYILTTFEDSSGDFWIGAFGSPLMRFDKTTGNVLERISISEGSGIAEIVEDPHDPNILWLGMVYNRGVTKVNKRTKTFINFPRQTQNSERTIIEEDMSVIVHDRQENALWLGSLGGGGLNKFNTDNERFTRYSADPLNGNSLSCDSIGEIYQDADGILWIGTLGGGLNKFDPVTETFTHYAEAHGIPSVVNSVVEDDSGFLWLSTNDGVLRFNRHSEAVESTYTKHDGLQGNAFLYESGLKTRSGEIWFGGTNGVNRVHPQHLTKNPYVPPILLTSLTQGGEYVSWDQSTIASRLKKVTLDWKHNFFEFEYAALNYTIPEKNQYKYKLEGLESDWYFAGNSRKGRYTAIPPGDYTLRIIGSNNNGIWNTEGVSLAITVIPPFWKTGWFYAFCIIGVFGIFLTTFYRRTRQLSSFNKILEQRLNERTQQLEEANAELMKWEKEQLERQMAGGFAHEMRNALTGVIIGLQMVMDDDETLCRKNSELLGEVFERLEPDISENRRQDVIRIFAQIDEHEETLDTVLKKTHECTTHALDVTKLILEYSKLGRTEAGKETVDVEKIVTRIYRDHLRQFEKQGILLYKHGQLTRSLLAHPSHIHSLINNLTLNARDALLEVEDERPLRIDIVVSEDADALRIKVVDTANGIPEEEIAKIFDPFFSTKPSTGTGLGLNYVSKIVTLYQGSVDVESRIGEGSTFTLTFPLK